MLTDEQRPHFHADTEIGRTVAFEFINRLVNTDRRTAAQVGMVILHMHALLLAALPHEERERSMDSYREAVGFLAQSMAQAAREMHKERQA